MRTPIILLLVMTTAITASSAKSLPNILWLSAEDISTHLGCYGDPHAITPNLDQLASEGVRYTHAFTSAGVCAPCRSSIITGMYQNTIGSHHMRCNTTLPDWVKPFPILLREAGYYCTNNSKTDYQFTVPSSKEIWNEKGGKAGWHDTPSGQPFFSVFNFTGCHESGIASESKYKSVTKVLSENQRQDASELTTLPPYYPDTPVSREDWKRNYELITALDHWVGSHLEKLEEAGLRENTIVMFWSDHGVGLPRAKRWLYDSGTRVPFIVRIPERFRVNGQGTPGSVSHRIINSPDFGVTVLNLAGVSIPEKLHGQPFLGKDLPPARKYAYGARDRMDERYDIIRAVRNHRYRYIKNFEPTKPYYQYMNTPEKGATMREIRRVGEAGQLPQAASLFFTDHKPAEELYDLDSDPHEINNLAANPQFNQIKSELQSALITWQQETGDMGLIPESELERLRTQHTSTYEILPRNAAALTKITQTAQDASRGPGAFDALHEQSNADSSFVRYWVATGFGNFARDMKAKETRVCTKLLEDPTPAVRIAAARALCRAGKSPAGIAMLTRELASDNQWARLEAAIVLDELDEKGRPALKALQAALENQPNKYIVRVANRAVNDLMGTHHTVP